MAVDECKGCLSLQRALLGQVTPALRRVSFSLGKDLIIIHFYFDGEPSEMEKELVGDIEAEVISDYPNSYNIESKIIVVNYPEKILSDGRIVFDRYT